MKYNVINFQEVTPPSTTGKGDKVIRQYASSGKPQDVVVKPDEDEITILLPVTGGDFSGNRAEVTNARPAGEAEMTSGIALASRPAPVVNDDQAGGIIAAGLFASVVFVGAISLWRAKTRKARWIRRNSK